MSQLMTALWIDRKGFTKQERIPVEKITRRMTRHFAVIGDDRVAFEPIRRDGAIYHPPYPMETMVFEWEETDRVAGELRFIYREVTDSDVLP